jgi:hypothetical protein
VWPDGLGIMKDINDPTWAKTYDLLPCSVAPQVYTLPRTPPTPRSDVRILLTFFKNMNINKTAVLYMKNGVFWDVTRCGSCKNRRFGGTWRLVRRFLVTASVVRISPILVPLMKVVLCSSEPSVLRRATRRNIPEDAILHSHRRENLKSYIALTGWTL